MQRILVTGSEGLVGRALCAYLRRQGNSVVEFDQAATGNARGDVTHFDEVADRVAGVQGIVHLAAVSRVIYGEQDPLKCRKTNVYGTEQIVKAALESPEKPWILFTSSREVYGNVFTGKASEDFPYAPESVYGKSKVEAERRILSARAFGLNTGVVRLSNVYGRARDYEDRVIPAFVGAALCGEPLRVEGGENLYDFTHLDDTVRGIAVYISMLGDGRQMPPIHLLTGVSTSLKSLANLVVEQLKSSSNIVESPPRDYGSGSFRGDNARAKELLHWSPKISLKKGITLLAKEIEEHYASGSLVAR